MVNVFIHWLENAMVVRQDDVSPTFKTWDAPVSHHVVQKDHGREQESDDVDNGEEGDVETIEIVDEMSPVKAKPDDWSEIPAEIIQMAPQVHVHVSCVGFETWAPLHKTIVSLQ